MDSTLSPHYKPVSVVKVASPRLAKSQKKQILFAPHHAVKPGKMTPNLHSRRQQAEAKLKYGLAEGATSSLTNNAGLFASIPGLALEIKSSTVNQNGRVDTSHSLCGESFPYQLDSGSLVAKGKTI